MLYTYPQTKNVRAPLLSNIIFAHLTHKLGIPQRMASTSAFRDTPIYSKHFSDMFEVVAAEVYRNYGFEALCVWVRDVFSPLMGVAFTAYNSYVFMRWVCLIVELACMSL